MNNKLKKIFLCLVAVFFVSNVSLMAKTMDNELLLHIPEGHKVSITRENLKKDFGLDESVCEEKVEGRSLVIVFDDSGSMSENNRIDHAKSAAIKAVQSMGENDETALITFGDCSSGGILKSKFTRDKEALINTIKSLTANNATPLADAIRKGGNYLRSNAGRTDMSLIVLSDGEEACGGNEQFELVRHKRRKAEGTIKKIELLAVDHQGEIISDSEVPENGEVIVRVIYKTPPELNKSTVWLTSTIDNLLVHTNRHERFECVYQSSPIKVKKP